MGPRFRGDDRRELANAPPPVLFEAPGRPPSIPRFRGGRFLPLDNSRGMERLEAHQSCVIRAAFWTARAPLGAPLAAFFLAIPGPRFRLPTSAGLRPRIATPCGWPRGPCLGQTSAVRRQPAPGRGSLVPPGGARHRPRAGLRGRRAGAASTGGLTPAPGGRAPHLRHRPFPAAPPSGSSLDDAPHRAGHLGLYAVLGMMSSQ